MNTAQQKELADIIERFSDSDGVHPTTIEGVYCIRLSDINARLPRVYNPCVCVVVQGRKQVLLEEEIYEYESGQYLAVSVDLPVIGAVTEGSSDKPYFCLQIDLDLPQIAEVLAHGEIQIRPLSSTCRGIFVGDTDAVLIDCVLRLARLLDAPRDINLLAPLIKREFYYRLLTGLYGHVIAQQARTGSQMQRIGLAIRELQRNYDKPVVVEELAARIGMSVSSFHAHFKTVTAMSPLQYQKRLRLLEARQIMLAEQRDAASTAYRVGYESPSQFNREYARLFGNPPARDIRMLLDTAKLTATA